SAPKNDRLSLEYSIWIPTTWEFQQETNPYHLDWMPGVRLNALRSGSSNFSRGGEIPNRIFRIPGQTILRRADNPTGHAVVCYQRHHNDNDELLPPSISCFVPATAVPHRRQFRPPVM